MLQLLILFEVLWQINALVPIVCPKATYSDWKSDVHFRFDENSRFDCSSSKCGGQCVALVKCNCGAPYTGLWSPGQSVSEYCKSRTNSDIEPGTAIATFDGRRYTNTYGSSHAAVFLGCTYGGNIRVMEQGCSFGTNLTTYTPSRKYYNRFKVIMTRQESITPNHHCSRRYTGC